MNIFFSKITMLAVPILCLSLPAQANHVKCKCPNIDARGTGDSSCSASESSGRCTIAFNEFDTVLERTAKDALQKTVRWREIQFTELPSSREFSRKNATSLSQNPELLIDQIIVYSLVSLAERGIVLEQDNHIKAAHDLMNNYARQISDVFVNGGGKIQDKGLTVTLGCFAFRTSDFWIMYKTAWSESIANNQC